MNTLAVIQVLAKVGKVLSTIVFVLAIVCGALCAAGIVSLAFIPAEGIQLGGTTLRGLVDQTAGVDTGKLYASMAAGIVLCVGEAVLAKLAQRYFKHELADGTPFTFSGARELMRLGICAVCIPIGMTVVGQVVFAVVAHALHATGDPELNGIASVGIGVMMIIAALLCKHGAEVTEAHKAPPAAEAAPEQPAE